MTASFILALPTPPGAELPNAGASPQPAVPGPEIPRISAPAISAPALDWLDDDLVVDEDRALLRGYVTPRRGHGRRWCWPADELMGGAP